MCQRTVNTATPTTNIHSLTGSFIVGVQQLPLAYRLLQSRIVAP